MSKYKGKHGGKKGQKIRAWVDPPPHSGNARKKTFFFHWCLPYRKIIGEGIVRKIKDFFGKLFRRGGLTNFIPLRREVVKNNNSLFTVRVTIKVDPILAMPALWVHMDPQPSPKYKLQNYVWELIETMRRGVVCLPTGEQNLRNQTSVVAGWGRINQGVSGATVLKLRWFFILYLVTSIDG